MHYSARLFALATAWGLLGACSGNVDPGGETGSGGSGGTPGAGGSGKGGAWGGYVYRASTVDKLDLLFMIDNSASMADKQQILAQAVPDLVDRLVNPRCLDANGTESLVGGDGKCPTGSRREFNPVTDIHIGIISSSLGGHGSDVCTPGTGYNERQEDMAHLVARKCGDEACTTFSFAPTYANKGFLFWDPKQQGMPPGDSDVASLTSKFRAIVEGTGQDGCGFEASLEAWYRFLIDPTPYAHIVPTDCNTGAPMDGGPCRGPDGKVDETVLMQRKDFLRPDSLVAVVMLTDENDCSVMEGGQGFLATQAYSGMAPFHLPRATSACASDPNSPECTSCGIPGHENDPACQKGAFADAEDALNLRCYRQKQRFGIDFLYPVRRYVYGLTQTTFQPEYSPGEVDLTAYPAGVTNGEINPLFCTEYEKEAGGNENRKLCKTLLRDPRLIFFATIVGVPWQDIARDSNDLTKGFRATEEYGWNKQLYDAYNEGKPPSQTRTPAPGVNDSVTVWDQIVGKTGCTDAENPTDEPTRKVGGVVHLNDCYLQPDPAPSGFPLDPLMVESIEPRTGVNPATGTQLAPADSPTPQSNPVNGHEWNVTGRNDLQYACSFKLPSPKQCISAESCDCASADKDGSKNPLCQNQNGSYGTIQYRAKAYPGRRQLATLRGVERLNPGQSVAASICPSNTSEPSARDYGYRPAIAAILERMRGVLSADGNCWGEQLQPEADGTVKCVLVEATKYSAGTSTCPPCDPQHARKEVSSDTLAKLTTDPNFNENGLSCACEIEQVAAGTPLQACISSTDDFPTANGSPVNGWCYVDPEMNSNSNPTLVARCPTDAKRMIRFVGEGAPVAGSLTYVFCH